MNDLTRRTKPAAISQDEACQSRENERVVLVAGLVSKWLAPWLERSPMSDEVMDVWVDALAPYDELQLRYGFAELARTYSYREAPVPANVAKLIDTQAPPASIHYPVLAEPEVRDWELISDSERQELNNLTQQFRRTMRMQ